MKSRYTYMDASSVQDIDKEQYPDPLSIQYNRFYTDYNIAPQQLSSVDIAKFFNFMQRQYGIQELDDILLSYNGVPYIGMLEPGNAIYLLKIDDLTKF